ncbi:ABC transporter permease [Lacrimispora sp.]|uniref:ABC transporter permease n=1 Tax=Lacrimispora sp. TaxID=2719234 RepID=UPI00289923AF|nr:ABC transporter permease subunit [Lacrimispora sp.]
MKGPFRLIAVLLFWLGVWQLLYKAAGQSVLVAAPADVISNLLDMMKTRDFYITVLHTLRNIIAGFSSAMLIGIALAVFTYAIPVVRILIPPFISVMKATPVASFIILALVFMKSKNLPILVSFLMVMPLVWGNMTEALHAVDRNLLEMSRMFQVPFLSQLRRIYLPGSIPYFLAAFQTGFGYAWKSAITAEVMSSPMLTIGRNMADAKVYLDTLNLFSWTLVVILLSIVTEKLAAGGIHLWLNRHFPPLHVKGTSSYD